MKVITIFGTRPEAIKMCPLILQLKRTKDINCLVCLTGQHKEMLKQVMGIFDIREDYNLNIMQPNQTLSLITVNVLNKLGCVLERENPDLILVHGDTTTSLAAALAGYYLNIPVGHVEAGLRTYNMHSPYPEEFNRETIDLISELYFAPTEQAKQNLLREGKPESKVYVTGNTVIDALALTVQTEYVNENLKWADGFRLILLTAHRRENIGVPMRNMFYAIKKIIEENPDVKVIYPVHKNPRVREIAYEVFGGVDRIRLIEPLGVYDFHNMISRSYLILTDSGGIQEEAPSLGKPVLVMRDTTERMEGVAAGGLMLVGTGEEQIYIETKRLLEDRMEYERMSKAVNPYGDGHASEKIAAIILKYFEEKGNKRCLK